MHSTDVFASTEQGAGVAVDGASAVAAAVAQAESPSAAATGAPPLTGGARLWNFKMARPGIAIAPAWVLQAAGSARPRFARAEPVIAIAPEPIWTARPIASKLLRGRSCASGRSASATPHGLLILPHGGLAAGAPRRQRALVGRRPASVMSQSKTTTTIDQLVCGSNLGQAWLEFGPGRPGICQRLAKVDNISTNAWPESARICRHAVDVVDFGQCLSRFRSILADVGPLPAILGHVEPNFDQPWPILARLWPTPTKFLTFFEV